MHLSFHLLQLCPRTKKKFNYTLLLLPLLSMSMVVSYMNFGSDFQPDQKRFLTIKSKRPHPHLLLRYDIRIVTIK